MENKRLFELFERYFEGSASEADSNELADLVQGMPDEELSLVLSKMWDQKDHSQVFFDSGVREKFLAKIKPGEDRQAPVITMAGRRRYWPRISVAVAVVLALSIGTILLVKNGSKQDVAETPSKKPVSPDIPPGTSTAILTLADGRKIFLDTASNGAVTEQGGAKIIKMGGRLSYDKENGSKEVLYNTITTPKGGQYQLELSDGSKVWLNAASSLRFPASFAGNERAVELTGEAYFEVAKNASMPFKVNVAGKGEVEVLGTHFNINSYPDEATINTTLLEGRVKVSALASRDSKVIVPGQQAQINSNEQIFINKDPNIEQVMAWKNGIFNFDDANLQTVMRQLARWYDVDIVYEGEIPQREFAGEMQRDLNLSQVLRILEKNNVQFRIEGKKLIVRR